MMKHIFAVVLFALMMACGGPADNGGNLNGNKDVSGSDGGTSGSGTASGPGGSGDTDGGSASGTVGCSAVTANGCAGGLSYCTDSAHTCYFITSDGEKFACDDCVNPNVNTACVQAVVNHCAVMGDSCQTITTPGVCGGSMQFCTDSARTCYFKTSDGSKFPCSSCSDLNNVSGCGQDAVSHCGG